MFLRQHSVCLSANVQRNVPARKTTYSVCLSANVKEVFLQEIQHTVFACLQIFPQEKQHTVFACLQMYIVFACKKKTTYNVCLSANVQRNVPARKTTYMCLPVCKCQRNVSARKTTYNVCLSANVPARKTTYSVSLYATCSCKINNIQCLPICTCSCKKNNMQCLPVCKCSCKKNNIVFASLQMCKEMFLQEKQHTVFACLQMSKKCSCKKYNIQCLPVCKCSGKTTYSVNLSANVPARITTHSVCLLQMFLQEKQHTVLTCQQMFLQE